MLEANVIFTLDGVDVTIQCSKEDKIKDICQKFANKVQKNINSLLFLYEGNQLNFLSSFKELAKNKNEIKVLVYTKEDDDFTCPKCGEKIKLNTEKIDDIILSINNLKEIIDSAKLLIENMIKVSTENNVNIQLKGVNLILNTLNEDIKKTKEKVKNLLNDYQIKNEDNNYILAEIIIEDEDVNKNKRILNSFEEYLRIDPDSKLKDKIYNNEDEIKKCEIHINDELIPFNYFHKFKTKGKYIIKYIFKNNLTNTAFMFAGCSSLNNIDLSNFNTNNVTNMAGMFLVCISLNNINLSNFNTNNVTNMLGMFQGCSSLNNINLSNFNTKNVTSMDDMFYGCKSLNNIDLSNFNTNNVTNMNGMFYGCSSLNNINLSNFNTNNVTNMAYMFDGCSSLNKNNIITKDKKLLNNFK